MSKTQRPTELRAETMDVYRLLQYVELGKIRVPHLRQSWRWDANDVRDLFDSLWRGIPIGTLLMWRRAADAEVLTLGPVRITCAKRTDAWFVVDGQQRLTALVGALLSIEDESNFYPFDLYFSLSTKTWHQPKGTSPIDRAWLPIRALRNVARLAEWAMKSSCSDEQLRMAGELQEAILFTTIVVTVVETENQPLLQDVFFRINYSGKRLSLDDSLNLRFFENSIEAPPHISDLRTDIAQLGFGQLDDGTLLRCVLFAGGRHSSQTSKRYLMQIFTQDRTMLLKVAREPLRQAVLFLQSEAGIPHSLLLPRAVPLLILSRFFAVYPDPPPRCHVLLVRWVWRKLTTFMFEPRSKSTHMIRAAMDVVEGSLAAEQSAAALLDQITYRESGIFDGLRRFHIDIRTDPVIERIQALALLTANPRSLVNGEPLDVSALLSEHGARAFQHILSKPPPGMPDDLFSSIANRVFHPPIDEGDVLALLRARSASPEQLASHDLPASLLDDRSDVAIVAALQARAVTLQRRVRDLVDLRCAWERPNRVSVSAILDEEDAEPEARTP